MENDNITHMNNFFSYAAREAAQDAFLCWCLHWFNERDHALFSLAVELLNMLGMGEIPEGSRLSTSQKYRHVDVLVTFSGLSQALIVEHKLYPTLQDGQRQRHEDGLRLLTEAERSELGLGADAKIHVAYLKVGFYYDYDRTIKMQGILTIDTQEFLSVLEKYVGVSEILDSYVEYLRDGIWRHERYKDFTDTASANFWEWNIACQPAAQYSLMDVIFHDRVLSYRNEVGSIQSGVGKSGRPWTGIIVAMPRFKGSDDTFFLFWRLDTEAKGPYLSFRFYDERLGASNAAKQRHKAVYGKLRDALPGIFEKHQAELHVRYDTVKNGYRGNYKESALLTWHIQDILRDWEGKKDAFLSDVRLLNRYILERAGDI